MFEYILKEVSRVGGINKSIIKMNIDELRNTINWDIRRLNDAISKGIVRNKYQTAEYVKKLEDFLTLDYFKGSLYKTTGEVLGNVKFFYKDSSDNLAINKSVISEVKKVKKRKGQISLFDDFFLMEDQLERALKDPDGYIKELEEENKKLEKDFKLAKFLMAYIMNHDQFFNRLYIGGYKHHVDEENW